MSPFVVAQFVTRPTFTKRVYENKGNIIVAQQNTPNLVFVITDDQGYGDLGSTGNPVINTPNLDALAQESVQLQNLHVGPTCSPTRAGIMTGHYCNSTGVWHTIGGRSLLRSDEVTMADIFRRNGYKTAMFGKWHLGDNYPFRPHDRGFDEALYHGGGGISQTPDYWGNDYFDDTYFRNGSEQPFDGYCTDVWFQEAMAFIARQTNSQAEGDQHRPFFCYLSTNAPHGPFRVPDAYSEVYRRKGVPGERANFYGMITNIDDNMARLRHHLRVLGLEENTILIFMTDNGSAAGCDLGAGQFVESGYNAGMRGKKGSPYEGGHRVPLFMHWPGGGFTEKHEVHELTANIDLLPTLIDLCDLEVRRVRGRLASPDGPSARQPRARGPDRDGRGHGPPDGRLGPWLGQARPRVRRSPPPPWTDPAPRRRRGPRVPGRQDRLERSPRPDAPGREHAHLRDSGRRRLPTQRLQVPLGRALRCGARDRRVSRSRRACGPRARSSGRSRRAACRGRGRAPSGRARPHLPRPHAAARGARHACIADPCPTRPRARQCHPERSEGS